jgi:hypothetical protein
MKHVTRQIRHPSARTLVVRRETLRALASVELVRAGGGNEAPGTGPVDSCPPGECTLGAA